MIYITFSKSKFIFLLHKLQKKLNGKLIFVVKDSHMSIEVYRDYNLDSMLTLHLTISQVNMAIY